MSERHWLHAENPNEPDGETAGAEDLWTRRSALALTAGFFALGSTPGAAAGFTHRRQVRATRVVISKKNRVLELVNGETTLKRYRIDLGFAPQGHKTRSGDGRTPEGHYFVDRRNPLSEYHLSLGINYPNPQDLALARAQGVNPGGDIFIHGEPTRGGRRRGGRDWTAGCVAVSNREMEEIWSMVPTGTPVTIFG